MSTDVAAARRKLRDLRGILGAIVDPVVGFSGGVDSSLLAVVARQEVGERVRAVIADSPSLPRRELDAAIALARRHDVPLQVVATDELHDPRYRANGSDRCAYCKDALVEAVVAHPDLQDRTLLLGVNVDDLGDHRPGQGAARRRGARFPLVEAGLGKHEVRSLARELAIGSWDKPAAACLASRLAYGVEVTAEALARIERAEEALRALGFAGDVRVRDQGGELARIEVPPDRLEDVVARRTDVVAALRGAGFRYVTLDLEGFRSGSQNLVITLGRKQPR
ncbi:MAG TPA: ATP-dependent sacrificial sulfur transferase LarE [Actinomycetota bacterium]|nr:ATP-dependent sacrificial sulfur transferase LarE [Actinomycetota bacterium]